MHTPSGNRAIYKKKGSEDGRRDEKGMTMDGSFFVDRDQRVLYNVAY